MEHLKVIWISKNGLIKGFDYLFQKLFSIQISIFLNIHIPNTKGKNCILRYCQLLFYDKFVQIFAVKKFFLCFKMGRTAYSYKKASEMLLLFLWRHAAKEMKISWMALIWISHISKLGCLYGCIYSRKWAKKSDYRILGPFAPLQIFLSRRKNDLLATWMKYLMLDCSYLD